MKNLMRSVLLIASLVAACGRGPTHDIVVANGRVMDPESGLNEIRNVGVRAGRVEAISTSALAGTRVIDATGLGAWVWLGGCQDDRPTGPGQRGIELPPFAVIVSDPAAALRASIAGSSNAAVAGSGDSVTYVSLSPGTVVRGSSVEIRNLNSGFARTELLVEGGLDPVTVPASVGDTLQLTVTDGSEITARALVVVARRRPPRVVRTEPPPKKRDVVLNARILIVFSEPIDGGTITSETVRLLSGGELVSGRPVLAADGLGAEFELDALLAPQAEYRLSISTGVADLQGDRLEQPLAVTFNTGTATASVDSVAVDSDIAGVYDLTALITTFDPVWGEDLEGYRYTAVLTLHEESGPPWFGGTYADLQLIGPGGDSYDIADTGFVAASIDFRGRLVIELLGDGNRIGLTLIVARLASGFIDGTFGCCGHIGGTFTATRRQPE